MYIMSYLLETRDGVRNELPLNLKRTYAKAIRTFEGGLWDTDPDLVKCVTLTTAASAVIVKGASEGELRNNWKRMVIDNRHLRHRMFVEGYPYRDCFCGEISAKNGLIHLHGFMVFEKSLPGDFVHERLSYHWSHIHGSRVVWVKNMWDARGAIAYDVKHAVKNYISEERYLYGDRPPHLLKSKDWLKPGFKAAEKEIARGMTEAVDFLPDDVTVSDEYYQRRYIPNKWEFARWLLMQWNAGESIIVDRDGFKVMIEGEQIYRMEFEIEDSPVVDEIEVGFPDEDEDAVNLIDDSDYIEMDGEDDNCE
jgi:hypothetical protein